TLPPPGSGHRRRAARGRVHVRPHAGSRVGAIRRRAPRPAREELGTAPQWHRDPDHPRLALRLVGPIAGARGVAPPAPGRRPRPRDAVVAHARRALRRARSQLLLGGARAAPRRHARRPEGRAPALLSRARDRGPPVLGWRPDGAAARGGRRALGPPAGGVPARNAAPRAARSRAGRRGCEPPAADVADASGAAWLSSVVRADGALGSRDVGREPALSRRRPRARRAPTLPRASRDPARLRVACHRPARPQPAPPRARAPPPHPSP